MREVILTANHEYFEQTEDSSTLFDDAARQNREEAFKDLAVGWLKEEFGDDVIYARADRDETAFHIHAVIMPRTEIDRSSWVRGQKRKAAWRKARDAGDPLPKKRYHKKTRIWREEQEVRLAAKRAENLGVAARNERDRTALDERTQGVERRENAALVKEKEAEAILEMAGSVANGGFAACPEPEETAPKRRRKAWRLFRGAFDAMRTRAEQEATDRLAEEFAAVKAAKTAIGKILKQLPTSLRTTIAGHVKQLIGQTERVERQMSPEGQCADRTPKRLPEKNDLEPKKFRFSFPRADRWHDLLFETAERSRPGS